MGRRRRWLLPEAPDLLGMLEAQVAETVAGTDAFARWATGDLRLGDEVRAAEHRADDRKTTMLATLREAFVTPLEPEDLFALSRGIDAIVNQAKDTVGEAEVMACPPDAGIAELAATVAAATHALADAVAALRAGRDAFPAAGAAIARTRDMEHVYRRAMAALLESDDLRHQIAMRELYRRCARIGDAIAEVAERVQYATVKES
jgi:uncharacterized protein Yka (UPF0111/DUF47 family)